MSVEATIEKKVKTAFRTENVFVQNESHLHSGPATESHFNLTIVSDYFSNLTRVKRHQAVYKLLSEELSNGGRERLAEVQEGLHEPLAVPQAELCGGPRH